MELLNKEEFDNLPNAEKRVAICQDVIARLDAGRIIPTPGQFWSNQRDLSDDFGYKTPQCVVNEHRCKVCAKGGLFASWVGNFNKVEWSGITYCSLEEVDKLRRVVPELVEIFGQEMLDNIEAAFENESYTWHYNQNLSDQYSDAFYDYDLRDIMAYIVKNKGYFPLPNI